MVASDTREKLLLAAEQQVRRKGLMVSAIPT